MSNAKTYRRIVRTSFVALAAALMLAASFIVVRTVGAQASTKNRIAFERANEIFVMDEDGSNEVALAIGFDPTWSPNGNKIAYTSGTDDVDSWNISVMNADGSGQTQLTTTGGYSPAWSPDGTKIVSFALQQTTTLAGSIRSTRTAPMNSSFRYRLRCNRNSALPGRRTARRSCLKVPPIASRSTSTLSRQTAVVLRRS